jgi:hypothetical protein
VLMDWDPKVVPLKWLKCARGSGTVICGDLNPTDKTYADSLLPQGGFFATAQGADQLTKCRRVAS